MPRWKGLSLTVRCDNKVAVTVLNTGRCRNPFLNSCLREICYLSASFEFEVRAVHLPGGENSEGDTLSHWHDNTSEGTTFSHSLVTLRWVCVGNDLDSGEQLANLLEVQCI